MNVKSLLALGIAGAMLTVACKKETFNPNGSSMNVVGESNSSNLPSALALAGMDDMDRFVLESAKPNPQFSDLSSETALLYMEASLNFRLGEPWKEVETIGTSENNFTVKAQLIDGEYVVNGDDIKAALGEMYNTIKSQTNKVLPTPDMPEITNGVDHIIGVDLYFPDFPNDNEPYVNIFVNATVIKALKPLSSVTGVDGVGSIPVGKTHWPMNSMWMGVTKGENCTPNPQASKYANSYQQIEMRMNANKNYYVTNTNPWYWSEVTYNPFYVNNIVKEYPSYDELWRDPNPSLCLSRNQLIQLESDYNSLVEGAAIALNHKVISSDVSYQKWGSFGNANYEHFIDSWSGKQKYPISSL